VCVCVCVCVLPVLLLYNYDLVCIILRACMNISVVVLYCIVFL